MEISEPIVRTSRPEKTFVPLRKSAAICPSRASPSLSVSFFASFFNLVLRYCHKFDVSSPNVKHPTKLATRKAKLPSVGPQKKRQNVAIKRQFEVETTHESDNGADGFQREAEQCEAESSPIGDIAEHRVEAFGREGHGEKLPDTAHPGRSVG